MAEQDHDRAWSIAIAAMVGGGVLVMLACLVVAAYIIPTQRAACIDRMAGALYTASEIVNVCGAMR